METLIHSNAPWVPTGYGAQVRLFAPRLAETREVAVSAFYGLEGARLNWDGVVVLPGLGGEFGNATLAAHAGRWFGGLRDGLVLTLMDVWVLEAAKMAKLNVASWVPVDHDPPPPDVIRFFLQSGAVPIAMGEFGRDRLEAAGLDPLYVPHAVDVDVFRPRPRDAVREKVGVPEGAFLVGMVAANKGRYRKGYQEALQAFSIFRRSHEDAHLYLHTVIDPGHAGGEDLPSLMASLQLPEGSVLVGDQYRMVSNPHPPDSMAEIFSTFDVLLDPAQGEGFGVPIVEAQACGVPAIVTEFSSMPEVCGAGWRVGWRPHWTAQKSWQAFPDVDEIVGALEEAHGLSKTKRAALSKRAREHALGYAVETVMERHMLPALDQVEEAIAAREPETLRPVAA